MCLRKTASDSRKTTSSIRKNFSPLTSSLCYREISGVKSACYDQLRPIEKLTWFSSISTSVSYISTHTCSYFQGTLSKMITQGGLRVSEKHDKSKAENVGQMLERVMTVAELLAKRSAEKSAEKSARK